MGAERLGEMEAFVQVVESGSMSAAARSKRITPSAISKLVSRLEGRLQVRLINRSTRGLKLTAEGQAFYESCVRLLDDIAEAENAARLGRTPTGRIRINTSAAVAIHVLSPLVAAFLELHPMVAIDISETDTIVDILGTRADVAIRTGPLKDSTMVARKLGESRSMIVASPLYLARHGMPTTSDDLARHNLIGLNYARAIKGWPLRSDQGEVLVRTDGRAETGQGVTMHQLALHGVGLARLPVFAIRHDLEAGRLTPVMEEQNPGDVEALYAVFSAAGGHVPARIRAFVDFLVENVRL